jgi:putative ABC transport system permease protein
VTRFGLALRNVRRNALRTMLTAIGVAIAVLSFVFIRTMIDAWTGAAEHAAKDRLATMHRVTFVMPLPRNYFDDFRGENGKEAIPGIEQATYLTWFGARHPTREDEFFSNLAVDPDTYFDVYSDMVVPADQLATWQGNRRGAIIGEALAKQFDWKVGDQVTLVGTIYPGEWLFDVCGVYTTTERSVDRAQFLFHWDYMNEAIPEGDREHIGWIASRIDDPSRAGEIAAAIDARFEERDVQTRSMSEQALNQEFLGAASAILGALDVVSFVILAIMLLILGNTIAMGVRERTTEYGVLLAVGFRPRQIAGFVILEGIAVGLLGGLLGLLVAYPFVQAGVGRFLEENMGAWFPYFRIPTSVAIAALVLAAAAAAIAAVLPAWRAAKLDVVDALRRLG